MGSVRKLAMVLGGKYGISRGEQLRFDNTRLLLFGFLHFVLVICEHPTFEGDINSAGTFD